MASAWRNGLTALITLVTTGIIVTGRTATTGIAVPWRIAVTATIGAGLTLAVAGLWHTLAAEVGARIRLHSLDDILAGHASVQAYQVGQAAVAGRRLQTARTLVATALALLLAGVFLTWWAPSPAASPPAYVQAATAGRTVCGTLDSADGGALRLTVTGMYEPVVIPLTAVKNLSVVANCP
jgi:hypothetical protein